MRKFCAECGAELPTKGKFCGSCGTPIPVVIHNCPTCGQEWNGEKIPTTPSLDKVKKVAPVKEAAPLKSEAVIVAINTSATVQPVYGSAYVAGKDCPNCGAVNMANKTCTTCESEN